MVTEIVPDLPKRIGSSSFRPSGDARLPIWARGNRCVHIYIPNFPTSDHKESEQFYGKKISSYSAMCNDKSYINDLYEPIEEIKPGSELPLNPYITGICSKCYNYLHNYNASAV